MHPNRQKLPRRHLATVWDACDPSPPPASLPTAQDGYYRMAAEHQGESLTQAGQQHRESPSILLSPERNGEPLTAGRAGCCILKYPMLSPIHFYSQSENNLPYNNTDTHSTAPGTHPSGHDATAQSSPEVRGEPQPGELCPISIPWVLQPHPAPSTTSHVVGGTCAQC